ncbi:FAD-binding oxidoreductase [Dokdonella immobilis]|uniref:Decaprenylphospho-beta-D-ribofuranose 2-oxidase n=1 Tax=Dokdonella immobilis TaxID=578942 RepID=A0A1I4YMG0_9GAMM|nr:FAD-binding protein [Dokdonella immobilis]SFN39238.1 decaprenylphospho-beta-D-ribofuranose 2-oxidase [Dokdonella immobilis]
MSPRRGFALAQLDLRSFDRSCAARCHVQKPDRYRLIEALPADVQRITRGAGVSYVDASFGEDCVVQDIGAFDRLIEFDAEQGLLTVEAGASVGDVTRFALGHGWLLPVVPGHPRASIGGCIAADVHGKNPARDGTFRRHVEAIELFDPVAGWLALDADDEAGRFDACFAGFGIPGLIGSATLRLVRAPAAYAMRSLHVASLVEAGEVLQAHAGAPVLYGWHDARPGHFGRGVVRYGLEAKEAERLGGRSPVDLPKAIAPWPLCAWNRLGIAAMNGWIQHRYAHAGPRHVAVEAALFPLNEARAYYAGFGTAGFVEAQWLVPHARYADFIEALHSAVSRLRPRISLIASKLFDGDPQGLSFDGRGIALAIQMPQPRERRQAAFIEALTTLALEHQARPNLIKDSSLDAASARRGIADFEAAREQLRRFDPGNLQRSGLTARLGL